MLLHDWQCMIIGPQQTHIGEFMYSVSIYVPDNWPEVRHQLPSLFQSAAAPPFTLSVAFLCV